MLCGLHSTHSQKNIENINQKLSLVGRVVMNEDYIAVYLSLIVYRCIPDPLPFLVGNCRYSCILLGAGNWSETEESAVGVCNQVSRYICDTGISSFVVSFRKVFTGFRW
jgi:hypothetical protein